MPGSRLPVLPHPGDDEPLGDWVARLVGDNRMGVHQLMQGSIDARTLRRLDRYAHPGELNRLHDLSGLPVEQLRTMTSAGRFPGSAVCGRWVPTDHARRAGDATCPRCGPDSGLTSRLRLIPLCGHCGRLLDDGTGYTETDVDPHLVQLRQTVTEHAQDAETYEWLRDRVGWLRAAIRHNWPAPPAHEPPGRLDHALRLLADDPTTTSPAVIAVLVTRALDPTVENDPELLVRHDTGWWPTAAQTDPAPLGYITGELQRLDATIRASGIEVRHVPLAITLGARTPLVHPKYLGRRETWAASVRQRVSTVSGTRSTLHHAMCTAGRRGRTTTRGRSGSRPTPSPRCTGTRYSTGNVPSRRAGNAPASPRTR